MTALRPVMRDWYTDPAEFSQRLEKALAREEAVKNVETEYAVKQAQEKGELFKDYGQYKADILERVSAATNLPHKSWEDKGEEWKAQKAEEDKEEIKQQKMLARKASKWLSELEAEFEEGDEK